MVAILLMLSLVDVPARGKPLPGGALQDGLIHSGLVSGVGRWARWQRGEARGT